MDGKSDRSDADHRDRNEDQAVGDRNRRNVSSPSPPLEL